MESSSYTIINDLSCNHLNKIARAINRQMQLMQSFNHPFKDLVDLNSPWDLMMLLDENEGLEVFLDSSGEPIGAIGFSKMPLWWAKEGSSVLMEEFVVSLNDSYVGFGRIAVRRLEELAKIHDCALIMSGNLLGTSPKQTENLYMKKAHFDFKYSHFLKVCRGGN
jgi:hypothetical protein